ncbi:hypothetical protein BDR26DRAFT_892945 [Obelidium mucronatum]|nr:hypothetical protein BDR26DRAFT_892945 [Obelidium mucronatum]
MWSNLTLLKEDKPETFRIKDNLTYGHEIVILGYHSNTQQTNSVSQNTRELFVAKGRNCSSMSSSRDGGGNWTTIAHCKDVQQKTKFLKPRCFVVMGTQAVVAYNRMIEKEVRFKENTLEIPQLPSSLQDMRALESETSKIPGMMHWQVVYNGKTIPKSLEIVMESRSAMEKLQGKKSK